MRLPHAIWAALIPALASSLEVLVAQANTFNSSFALSDAQIRSANLTALVASDINVVTRFERSNWATGSVLSDPFYTSLPANASAAPPGALLKVEAFTDTARYSIAPALALSRIVYQSRTLNGSLVPVSAYVLWPYRRRDRPSGSAPAPAPLVSWGHGMSGIFAECAPSHMRNLRDHFAAPYALALAGYAVVGSDYAGLGVPFFPNGSAITHQSVASPAAGNDLLYAAQAAHAAFPHLLTRHFVVTGHSQGGGAAWAAAQQQLTARVPGYLGAVAISPTTNAVELSANRGDSLVLLPVAKTLVSVFQDLSLSDMLTPAGLSLLSLLEEIQGCNPVFDTALTGQTKADPRWTPTRDSFLNSSYVHAFANLTVAGGKDFAGPLMVLQGTADEVIPEQVTTKYVNKTCHEFPGRGIHYVKARAMGHNAILYAAQQTLVQWLDERFAEAKASIGHGGEPYRKCIVQDIGVDAPRPLDQYRGELNYFLEYSQDEYQIA